MKKLAFQLGLIALLSGFISFNACALPITFFGEDANTGTNYGGTHASSWANSVAAQQSFLNYINPDSIYIETFQGFADGTGLNGESINVDFGEAGTGVLQGGYVSGDWDDENELGPVQQGRFSVSDDGDHFLELPTSIASDGGTASFSLSFEKAQSAFGFYATDLEKSDVELKLTMTLENLLGQTLTYTIPHNKGIASGSVLYFGVLDTDTAFTKVTFTGNNITRDWFGFDDFTIATKEQIVPEAATFVFLSMGIAGLLAFRRKKIIA